MVCPANEYVVVLELSEEEFNKALEAGSPLNQSAVQVSSWASSWRIGRQFVEERLRGEPAPRALSKPAQLQAWPD